MKARVPKPKRQLPPKAINAVNKEIKREIIEQQNIYLKHTIASFLWAEHRKHGGKAVALQNLCDIMLEEYKEMLDFYGKDMPIPAEYRLKELGFDIDKAVDKFLENININVRIK